MTDVPRTFLLFGATGRTGRPFLDLVLHEGHHVRAVVRGEPAKLAGGPPQLDIHQGSTTENLSLDELLEGVDTVIVMVGDAIAQRHRMINAEFVRALVPAMRRQGVRRLLYQAGGFSEPPGQRLSVALRLIRSTLARSYLGQHRDNEAVMRYLDEQARDIAWIVHRAALRQGNGSKGVLHRSERRFSVATFTDCAAYSYRIITDPAAVHTCDGSRYGSRAMT